MKTIDRILCAFLVAVLIAMLFIATNVDVEGADDSKVDITDISQLGDITHYNGFIFGDYMSERSDAEGAMAIGGNSKIGYGTSGQFDVGACAYNGYDGVAVGDYVNHKGYPSLLLKQRPDVGNGTTANVNVYGGDFVLKHDQRDGYESQSRKINKTAKYAENEIVDTYFNTNKARVTQLTSILQNSNSKNSLDISQFAGWNTDASIYDDMSMYVPDNLVSNGSLDIQNVLVLNIEGNSISINGPQIPSKFDDYDLIIFNFKEAVDVKLNGSGVLIDGVEIDTTASKNGKPAQNAIMKNYAQKIVWNFPVATKIESTSVGIVGSVIAPYADVTGNGGSINGMLISESFHTLGACELHGFSLNKSIFDLMRDDGNTDPEDPDPEDPITEDPDPDLTEDPEEKYDDNNIKQPNVTDDVLDDTEEVDEFLEAYANARTFDDATPIILTVMVSAVLSLAFVLTKNNIQKNR